MPRGSWSWAKVVLVVVLVVVLTVSTETQLSAFAAIAPQGFPAPLKERFSQLASLDSTAPSSTNTSGFNSTDSTATTNGDNSLPFPLGDIVTFSCTHGSISLNNLGTVCTDQVVSVTVCKASCKNTMTGAADTGYVFQDWTSSGDAYLNSTTSNPTTLTTCYANPANTTCSNSGTVTLYVRSQTTVTETFNTFENWSTGWTAGEIKACLKSVCNTYANGQSASLYLDATYTLTAVSMPASWRLHQWSTDSGTLSSTTSNPASIYITGSGEIAAMINTTATLNWVGYVYSPQTTSSLSSASTTFVISSLTQNGGSKSVWAGIGGINPSLNLWQAGVYLTAGNKPQAWYEAVGSGCTYFQSNCNPVFGSMAINVGDTVVVNVYSNQSGYEAFNIRDLSNGNDWHLSWTGTLFTPFRQTTEWIMEVSGLEQTDNLTRLLVDGGAASLYGGYMIPLTSFSDNIGGKLYTYPYVVGPLSSYTGSTYFVIG